MSQKAQIRKHLMSGQSISQLEAFGIYGCFRLAARIAELRDEGMRIYTETRHDPTGKAYARYVAIGRCA